MMLLEDEDILHLSTLALLMKHKANINAQHTTTLRTVLHLSSIKGDDELAIEYLLWYGANVDIKDTYGNVPLKYAKTKDSKNGFIKYFAMISIEKKAVSEENMNIIHNDEYLSLKFKHCSDELIRMKSIKLFGNLNLFNLFRKNKGLNKKYVFSLKCQQFKSALRQFTPHKFKHYGMDLEFCLGDLFGHRESLDEYERVLYPLFKSIFPDTVIRKICIELLKNNIYYANEFNVTY